MTASEEVRVQRRLDELMENGTEVSFDAVKKNLSERDYLDTHRAISPLIKTKDALVLDNSCMTRAEQLSWILEQVSLKCL